MNAVEVVQPDLISTTRDSEARDRALRAASSVSLEPTSLVAYRSQGRLLIIGAAGEVSAIAAKLKDKGLRCYGLAIGEGISQVTGDLPMLSISPRLKVHIAGYLGEFSVTLVSEEQGEIDLAQAIATDRSRFDLILDLSAQPLLSWEMLPLGYYAPREDEAELQRVLDELPSMVGEFEKAKFFHYNPDICAHGSSGLQGCRRCLDACPSGAITSLLDKIAVDPYLCQGGGSCATACPSGAIIYNFPKPADTLNRLHVLLRTYHKAGGGNPVLLFHDAEAGKRCLKRFTDQLPGNVIPIEVEEVGSIGMEMWLAALAYGATRVLLLETPEIPPSTRREIQEQLGFAHALLEAMGYPRGVLRSCRTAEDSAFLTELTAGPAMPSIRPADFASGNAKRENLFFAVDFLATQSSPLAQLVTLPKQAPFGEIGVDQKACTLCMACVSVCPASALFDGGDVPRLDFLEANCVQCGLCELACPEDAITLHPRFLFDPQQRRRRRLLHEEEAFCCSRCGKPFATPSLIARMKAKLSGHRMFQDEAALKRLLLCGDCRVRDMFDNAGQSLR
jgi:ferredoxin